MDFTIHFRWFWCSLKFENHWNSGLVIKSVIRPVGWHSTHSWLAPITTFSTLFFFYSTNNFSLCEKYSMKISGPIELRPFGHVPLILAKGQCWVQSSYSTQLHLIHLGKLNCTWLFQAQLDCALKFPHSIWLCSKCVMCHLVTCRFRHIPKGGTFREA